VDNKDDLTTHTFMDVLFEEAIECSRCLLIMKEMLNFPHLRARPLDIKNKLKDKMQPSRVHKHLNDLVLGGYLIKIAYGEDDIAISYVINYKMFPDMLLTVMENTELNKTMANAEIGLLELYVEAVFGYIEGMKDSFKRILNTTNAYYDHINLLKEFFRKI
jgi:hypothetical protein